MITATRYHDFSAGHRVVGHESKCKHLHGHNYRVTFTCAGELDDVGRVIDFGVIKSTLSQWLEDKWDHKMILWNQDKKANVIATLDGGGIVTVPFNPTAENMAIHLIEHIGPQLLKGTGVRLIRVQVQETRKCAASAEIL